MMYDKVAYVLMVQDRKGEWQRYFSCWTQKAMSKYVQREYLDSDETYRIEVWDRKVLEICQDVEEIYGHHKA